MRQAPTTADSTISDELVDLHDLRRTRQSPANSAIFMFPCLIFLNLSTEQHAIGSSLIWKHNKGLVTTPNPRMRLFLMINDLPTIYEVVTGKAKQSKDQSANSGRSKSSGVTQTDIKLFFEAVWRGFTSEASGRSSSSN
ncbi:Uncharacterized protein Rs2_04105 [Raphanus sativus]|nr:Uncharacterized protein Rs2_04105 [Raphanus sativus]